MYIPLVTSEVWPFTDDFLPEPFLRQLPVLLQEEDILAFGAYEPSPRLCDFMAELRATQGDTDAIYFDSFKYNLGEHPNGRPFELPLTQGILEALIKEALRMDGQNDKPLFFDHFVAYRRGVPIVPLLCFHDAFFGGVLQVSGHYWEETIRIFAEGLPSRFKREAYP